MAIVGNDKFYEHVSCKKTPSITMCTCNPFKLSASQRKAHAQSHLDTVLPSCCNECPKIAQPKFPPHQSYPKMFPDNKKKEQGFKVTLYAQTIHLGRWIQSMCKGNEQGGEHRAPASQRLYSLEKTLGEGDEEARRSPRVVAGATRMREGNNCADRLMQTESL